MVEYIREELALKTIAKNIKIQYNSKMEQEIVLTLSERIKSIDELKDAVDKGKRLNVEIKPYRAKRSNDANAMLWLLLQELAIVLNTSKDELYLLMLKRYGVFTHIVVKKNVVDRVKAEWRTVRELGEVTIGGQQGVQLQCYFGSSTYDTKEFSTLLSGVISECKEVGIDTITESEKSLLLSEWSK